MLISDLNQIYLNTNVLWMLEIYIWIKFDVLHESLHNHCCNLTLREWEDETHIPKIGTWESSETLETSEFDCRGQKTLHWGVFYIIGKLSKCRCRKWVRTGHLDIYNTHYGKKKGRELNWQFDSWPLKIGNRPDLGACRWSAIHRWKALKESYKFASNLIPIGGLSKVLWHRKVQGIQTGTISRLLLGSLGTKNHSDVGAVERRKEYYMGEGGGFPRFQAVVSLVSPKLPVAYLYTKGAPESDLINLLVGLMHVK